MLRTVGIAILLFIAALAVAPAGSPLQLSYVYSDSMEPTIGTDDGYVLVPAGDVSEGDVVTFRAPDGDGYVTHRVVEETEQGFVTRGDNNPSTDQSSGHPHVQRGEVVGRALSVGGSVVVIPQFGAVVETLRQHRLAVLAGLAALALAGWARSGGAPRQRAVPRADDFARPLFAVSLVALAALLVWGGTVQHLQFVAVGHESAAPGTVTVGEPHTTTVDVRHHATPITQSVVAVAGATVTNQTENATAITADLRVPPQAETGTHTARFEVYQYPAVLPAPVLRRLHGVHPAVPAGITATIVVAPLYAAYRLTVDGRTPLRPSRRRWLQRLLEDEG